jgi:hypothetical protein
MMRLGLIKMASTLLRLDFKLDEWSREFESFGEWFVQLPPPRFSWLQAQSSACPFLFLLA